MASRLPFLLCLHQHQPVGNFDRVVGQVADASYRPLLAALRRHPAVKVTLHFTGSLLEILERIRPDVIDTVGTLVSRGQAELLTGGFYEPILPLQREEDRLEQIAMLTAHLRSRFGAEPRGAWVAERIWEPSLASTLARAGVSYVPLDDTHFRWAGLTDLHRAWVTEDQGRTLTLLPIDMRLRYLIPFRPVEAVEEHLRSLAGIASFALMGDDGEKFGAWPHTHDWVHTKGWLERFLRFLESSDGIVPMTLGEALAAEPPVGPVYLPPASYREMTEWALPASRLSAYERARAAAGEEGQDFVRGGIFRGFLSKYPEGNLLHKRVLRASETIGAAGPREARESLFRAQCNDAYWHGVFGGLYLFHLRDALWSALLAAEEKGGMLKGRWEIGDLDADGAEEWVFGGTPFGVTVAPARGGAILSIDVRPPGRNIANILSRRFEAYHEGLAAASGQGEGVSSIHEIPKELPEGAELVYDRYRRAPFIDHFLPEGGDASRLGIPGDLDCGDFAGRPYEPFLESGALILRREGIVSPGPGAARVSVEKAVECAAEGLRIGYTITHLSGEPLSCLFVPEVPLSLMEGEWSIDGCTVKALGGALKISFEGAEAVGSSELATVSQSEQGMESAPQGVIFLPRWRLDLAPGEALSFAVRFTAGDGHIP